MPLYFFDVYDGERCIRDETGIMLDSPDAIEAEAINLLQNLVHQKMPTGRCIMTVSVHEIEGIQLYHGLMTISGKRFN